MKFRFVPFVLALVLVVAAPAFAALPGTGGLPDASDGPTISPRNAGDRAVNDTSSNTVDVGGTVPTSGAISAARFVGLDASGSPVVTQRVPKEALRPPTPFGQYLYNDGGQLDGVLQLSCEFGPPSACGPGGVRTVFLQVDIDGTSYDSTRLPVDYVRPEVLRFELVRPDRIRVTFTEAVRHPQGDLASDYDVSNPDRGVLRVEGPTTDDCTGIPTARPDITNTGCTRTVVLDRPVGEDETGMRVEYEPTTTVDDQPIPGREAHRDFASLRAFAAGLAPFPVADLVRPAIPRIEAVEGRSPSAAPVIGKEPAPSVALSNLTPGHAVRIEAVSEDGTRLSGTWTTVEAATATLRAPRLPTDEDATYTLSAVARDDSGNLSTESSKSPPRSDGSPASALYRMDLVSPTGSTATGDGRFVTVRFTESITGANRPGDWKVSSGGPVEAVSGSGHYRVVRTTAPASGTITWTRPTGDAADPYRDAAGNVAATFSLPIDQPGQVRISDVSTTEGAPLTFTVSVARRAPADDDDTYTVDFSTVDGTATAGEDYTAKSGRLSFGPGVHSHEVEITTLKDEDTEGSETLTLQLSNPTGGARLPNPSSATGTILDPGATEGLSVFDTRAHEGSTARAVLQLGKAATKDVTVRWATEDGTAKAGSDYTASSGTARIPAGAREATVVVPLTADDADEPTETFTIRLSDPVNATLSRAVAKVSILDGAGVAPGIGRISGPSRVETSAAISKAFYAAADTVVVATANAYPDALAGAPLAEKHGAPILLTTRERLHPAITTEVKRLGATTALVLGGANALSAQVDRDLRAAGVTTVRRLSGQNRFDTARIIAAEVGGDAVYVVEGAHADPKRGWPDAVAVSALAAAQQRAILLVERDRLPGETSAALTRLSPSRATIVGGPAAVNDSVARAVDERAGTVDRVAGRTRYETSRAVASKAVAAGFDPGNTFFATGDDWPDSLSASPAVARTGGILLLVSGTQLDHSPPAREWLVTHRDRLRSITLIGGPKAISETVASQIRSQSGLQPR